MANKTLFAAASKAPSANVKNEAGGRAYAFSPAHALAQYAATCTFGTTFNAAADEQLDTVLELCRAVQPSFVAKTAL